jgi:hypothetical protein
MVVFMLVEKSVEAIAAKELDFGALTLLKYASIKSFRVVTGVLMKEAV